MSQPTDHPTQTLEDDPRYRNAKREAVFILSLWLCCFLYTVIFCYLHGYKTHEHSTKSTGPPIGKIVGELKSFNRTTPLSEDKTTVQTPFGTGIPDWVFWGILAPWLVCILVSCFFCLFIFVEDPLDDEPDQSAAGEE